MTIKPVPVEDVKVGMTISLHGTISKIKRIQGGKGRPKGFHFSTDQHKSGCFYMDGSTVWTVVRKKGGAK